MQKPMGRIEVIAASSRAQIPGSIPFVRARTLTVTARMTFGAGVDEDATVELYYSPDGEMWDTIIYANQAVTYTAAGTVQKTFIVDPPEHGHLSIWILNGSDQDTITDVRAWYSIQSWGATGGDSRGLIDTANVYD